MAAKVTPLSQRDPRWKAKKLGFSNYTIGDYGCTLTCLTVLINFILGTSYRPDEVNDMLKSLGEYDPKKNRDGAFSGALLVWANVPKVFPSLKWIYRDYNYSNVGVAWYVYVLKMPVMVEVNAASIGASKHWVLYIGDQLMMDPWYGTLRKTNSYPATGDARFQRA